MKRTEVQQSRHHDRAVRGGGWWGRVTSWMHRGDDARRRRVEREIVTHAPVARPRFVSPMRHRSLVSATKRHPSTLRAERRAANKRARRARRVNRIRSAS